MKKPTKSFEIALSALAGATLIGGSAAFITLKIKARREENV